MSKMKANEEEIRKESWRCLPGFITRQTFLSWVVNYIKTNSLDTVFHATTSHKMLNVGAGRKGKYHLIRIEEGDKSVFLEYFDGDNLLSSVNVSPSEARNILEGQFSRLQSNVRWHRTEPSA